MIVVRGGKVLERAAILIQKVEADLTVSRATANLDLVAAICETEPSDAGRPGHKGAVCENIAHFAVNCAGGRVANCEHRALPTVAARVEHV